MTTRYIKLEGTKLWNKLLQANILEFESDSELRYIVKEYEVDTSRLEGRLDTARVRIMLPDSPDDSIYLAKEEILNCEATWDNVDEEINIHKLNGKSIYIPPFRLYKELNIMDDE